MNNDCKIFYSWQSDLPNNQNKGFIWNVLKEVKQDLHHNQIKISLDEAVRGTPGSQDVTETVFGKISKADIFVCDISIVNQEC